MSEKEGVSELGPREDVLRAIIGAIESTASFSDYSPIALVRLLQAIATIMWFVLHYIIMNEKQINILI